jgi:uncharacterized protein YfaT (DUF1175 family)
MQEKFAQELSKIIFRGHPNPSTRFACSGQVGHLVNRTLEKKKCKYLKVKGLSAKMGTHEN